MTPWERALRDHLAWLEEWWWVAGKDAIDNCKEMIARAQRESPPPLPEPKNGAKPRYRRSR